MDLAFGTNVREHGYRIGRLIGIEVDQRTRAVRNILIGHDATLGKDIERRSLAAVPMDHFDGDIVLHFSATEQPVVPAELLALSDATRVNRGGREIGRLSGVEVSPDTGQIVAIVGRQHWWTRRFHLAAAGLDSSAPSEIRVDAAPSQAA